MACRNERAGIGVTETKWTVYPVCEGTTHARHRRLTDEEYTTFMKTRKYAGMTVGPGIQICRIRLRQAVKTGRSLCNVA